MLEVVVVVCRRCRSSNDRFVIVEIVKPRKLLQLRVCLVGIHEQLSEFLYNKSYWFLQLQVVDKLQVHLFKYHEQALSPMMRIVLT